MTSPPALTNPPPRLHPDPSDRPAQRFALDDLAQPDRAGAADPRRLVLLHRRSLAARGYAQRRGASRPHSTPAAAPAHAVFHFVFHSAARTDPRAVLLAIDPRAPLFGLRGLYAFAAAPGWYIPRNPYLWIGLSPLVLISIFGLLLVPLIPQSVLFAWLFGLTYNAAGAAGDLYFVFWLLLPRTRSLRPGRGRCGPGLRQNLHCRLTPTRSDPYSARSNTPLNSPSLKAIGLPFMLLDLIAFCTNPSKSASHTP